MIVSDALEENSKDLIADKAENLLADKLFVKGEAIPEAGKKEGMDSKKKNRRIKKNDKKKTEKGRKSKQK